MKNERDDLNKQLNKALSLISQQIVKIRSKEKDLNNFIEKFKLDKGINYKNSIQINNLLKANQNPQKVIIFLINLKMKNYN